MSPANVKKHDWSLVLVGVCLFIIGIILFAMPYLTMFVIAVVVGTVLLITGIVDILAYIRLRGANATSGWTLLYGICNIILGLLFLVHPLVSSLTIPWLMGIVFFAFGIFEGAAAFRERSVGISTWALALASAVVDILCGIMFIVWPATFAIFLAVFLLMRGVSLVVIGYRGEVSQLRDNMLFR